MKCPSCKHQNLTDFPFCEQCLTLLPVRPGTSGAGGFDLDRAAPGAFDADDLATWPPFPWNPRKLAAPVIGRERAIKKLGAGFDAVVDTWTSRIHLLVSEYGMGKARVAKALVDAAQKRHADTRVIRARCPASGGPFRMWDALLRAACDVPASGDAVEAGARLVATVEEALPDEALEIAGPIAHLLDWEVDSRPRRGPGIDDEALNGRGTAALIRLFAAMSIQQPLLIIVDNANRASARSLALAGAVEATLKNRPMMMLLSGSPELQEILPGWDLYPCTQLTPLSRSESEKMLRLYFTGIKEVPKDLMQRILGQGKGNPYALKSLVRYLREAGGIRLRRRTWEIDESVAWDLDMPETLEGVVLAQIGILTPSERTTLARAAVIGSEFWLSALVALQRMSADDASEPGVIQRDQAPEQIRQNLERLTQLRFIESRHTSLAGEEAFGFRSGVHWNVARGILPATTQERFHRFLLQWLLVRLGDDTEAHLSDLARHAEAAGDQGEAAKYLLAAAGVMHREHRWAEQRDMLESAKALVDEEDLASRLSIDSQLGEVLAVAGDQEAALECFQGALNIAWRMRHRRAGAAALTRIGCVERDRGNLDKAYGHLLRSLRLFDAVDDAHGAAHTCIELGRLLWIRADFEQALRVYQRAEQLSRSVRDRRGLGNAVHYIGALHLDRGDLDLATEYLEDALDLRRRIDDRRGIVRTLSNLGVLRFTRSDNAGALEAWEEGNLLAIELGDIPAQSTLANNLGEVLVAEKEYETAKPHLERAISLSRDADIARTQVDALRNMGVLHVANAAWKEAAEALTQAQEAAKRLGLAQLIAHVERSFGDLEAGKTQTKGDLADGAEKRAIEAFQRSANGFRDAGYDLEAAISLDHLATFLDAQQDRVAASEARSSASELRRRHGVEVSTS
ncbi:MAG: ATP-binding protein [Myxococcota bacterium]